MMKLIPAAAAVLLSAAGAAAQTEDMNQPEQPDPRRNVAMQTESRVLNLMRLSNEAEIRAAEIVLERTQSDTVRRFADRLLRDHRLNDEMLSSLAESKGIALIPASFDGETPPAGTSAAPPGDADTLRNLEGDDLYRQPMGQSPSLAPRDAADPGEAPGRLSANPLQHAQEQPPDRSPEGWELPQISEPPSAEQVNWREPAGQTGQSQEQGDQTDLGEPGSQPDQADLPRPIPGETPRQPRDPAPPEDPPAPGEDQAGERPLDIAIAQMKAQRMLRELEGADDESLDGVYAAAMIKSHDETVQNLRTGLQSVADADVEDLLETFIPILEQHGRLARHVQRELGGEAAPDTDLEEERR